MWCLKWDFIKGCSYWYAARFMEVENGCIWKATTYSGREPLSTSTMEEGYLSCSSHPCWVPTIWSHSNICTYPVIVTRTIHTCLVGDRCQPSLATGASQNIFTWDVLLSQRNMKIHVKDSHGIVGDWKDGIQPEIQEFWPCFRHHMDIWHVFYRSRP